MCGLLQDTHTHTHAIAAHTPGETNRTKGGKNKLCEAGVNSPRLHHRSKYSEITLISKQRIRHSPENERVFAAVVGVMLHIVEETEEVFQSLKADLITNRDKHMRYKSEDQSHISLGAISQ